MDSLGVVAYSNSGAVSVQVFVEVAQVVDPLK